MNTLMAQDSPILEALALNYLTFGFQTLANNLWAWITVITTAAITFWGTNTTTASPQDLPPTTTTVQDDDYEQFHSSSHAPSTIDAAAPPTSIFAATDSIGRRSGKFAVYFDLVEEEEEEEEDEEDFEERDIRAPEEWEERLRMRMDLSWYSFQDLTVIDGNVVKMWEEDDYTQRRRLMTNVFN